MSLELILSDSKKFPHIRSKFQIIAENNETFSLHAKSMGVIAKKQLSEPTLVNSFRGMDMGKLIKNIAKKTIEYYELSGFKLIGLNKSIEGDFDIEDTFRIEVYLDRIKPYVPDLYLLSAQLENLNSEGIAIIQGFVSKGFQPFIKSRSREDFSVLQYRQNNITAVYDHEILPSIPRIKTNHDYSPEMYIEQIIKDILYFQGLQAGHSEPECFDFEIDENPEEDMAIIRSSAQILKVSEDDQGKPIFNYSVRMKPQTYLGRKQKPLFMSGLVKYHSSFNWIVPYNSH